KPIPGRLDSLRYKRRLSPNLICKDTINNKSAVILVPLGGHAAGRLYVQVTRGQCRGHWQNLAQRQPGETNCISYRIVHDQRRAREVRRTRRSNTPEGGELD